MTTEHRHSHHDAPPRHPEDDIYTDSAGPVWSGNPNSSLVAVIQELDLNASPSQSLDVGCGEGADVLWLAEHGWKAVGVDPSEIAISRAIAAATERGIAADFEVAKLPDNSGTAQALQERYGLVTGFYIPVKGDEGLAAITSLVAPGGYLVLVHHDFEEMIATGHQSPDVLKDYLFPSHIAEMLSASQWTIVINESRERHVATGLGHGHTLDNVLVARLKQGS
ncbi:class I SAM-dependent methyltransferase [Corynebacterium ulcerans]|uniref:class I SAM-dependent methyltransferase n=1 Tax=Corynebacterium ulcerans TaxID=65058 RepID=UPI0034A340E7